MSVQEYLSTSQPQVVVRWMGMRRALIALVVAAAVAIAGVAAHVSMVRGSLHVRGHDAAHRRRRPGAFDRGERNGLDLHSGDRPDHGRVNRDPHRRGPTLPFISASEPAGTMAVVSIVTRYVW